MTNKKRFQLELTFKEAMIGGHNPPNRSKSGTKKYILTYKISTIASITPTKIHYHTVAIDTVDSMVIKRPPSPLSSKDNRIRKRQNLCLDKVLYLHR